MPKDKKTFLHFFLIALYLSLTLLPSFSFAYTIPASPPTLIKKDTAGTIRICPGEVATSPVTDGLTARLIPCIRDIITYTAFNMLTPFVDKFTDIFTAVITLAIAVFGISVMITGGVGANRKGMVLAVKIGAVTWLVNTHDYKRILNIMEDLINIIANIAVTPGLLTISSCSLSGTNNELTTWQIFDCYLGKLIGGISNTYDSSTGIAGFIVGSMTSSPFGSPDSFAAIGFVCALVACYIVLVTILTVARTIYIFLLAYFAVSFMFITSPIFIPCILFQSTKSYFDGWLKATIAFILQPVFLFAYLVLFLFAFNFTIFEGDRSLYYAIAGDDSQTANFRIGPWLNGLSGSNPLMSVYIEKTMDKKYKKLDHEADVGECSSGTNPTCNTDGTPKQSVDSATQDYHRGIKQGSSFLIGTLSNPTVFFEEGKKVNALDWSALVSRARPAEWATVTTFSDGQDVILKYQLGIFVALLTSAVILYIFYSLLGYLPYIGSGVMEDAGVMSMLSSTASGSRIYGGGK